MQFGQNTQNQHVSNRNGKMVKLHRIEYIIQLVDLCILIKTEI